MSVRAVVLTLVLALAVLGSAWFLANYDRVAVREWVGPTGEARLRPFLAAQRFAERMGMKVVEVRSVPQLAALPAGGAFLMPKHRQELHAEKLAELVRWVERGGHLIVEAELLGVPDPLLERLAVVRSQAEPLREPFTLALPEGGRRLRVFMPEGMRLAASASEIYLQGGGRLVSFARGDGVVTAATSLRFASNPSYYDHLGGDVRRPGRSIGTLDHAELLWNVLSLTPGSDFHVYFRPEKLSLWGFLTENAASALAAGALLLALWLWRIVPRFGPIAPDAPPGHRRLLDHLRASGRYYWARGLRSRLVVAARDAALRRITRAQPDFAAASQTERIARLSSLAGISRDEAARFISAAGTMRGADFIRIAHHAQRVHSALEKGAK